ncbi:hypothetical protein L218DRAFT_948566 [Marasmius fiardii PR-910]|nr:hypothetical protein L218DRAFT_948566 [Marasmius fiardii PR-910]
MDPPVLQFPLNQLLHSPKVTIKLMYLLAKYLECSMSKKIEGNCERLLQYFTLVLAPTGIYNSSCCEVCSRPEGKAKKGLCNTQSDMHKFNERVKELNCQKQVKKGSLDCQYQSECVQKGARWKCGEDGVYGVETQQKGGTAGSSSGNSIIWYPETWMLSMEHTHYFVNPRRLKDAGSSVVECGRSKNNE